MKRNGSLPRRVLLNNLLLFGITMSAILIFICLYVCDRQRIDADRADGDTLKQYVWEINRRMADGVEKSNSILTWPYLIDNLEKSDKSNYEKLDCSNNIKIFMDNVENNTFVKFTIYVENDSLFQNEYINYAQELDDIRQIKENIRAGAGIYWEDKLFRDGRGTAFLRFYTGSVVNDNCIIECLVSLPETDGHTIQVTNAGDAENGDCMAQSINDTFSAVLIQDRTALRARQRETVFIIVGIGVMLLVIVFIFDYKATMETFKGLIKLISGLQQELGELAGDRFPERAGEAEEVAAIKQAFNALTEKVRRSAEEQYRLRNEKKNLEIFLLGKQLEPHMLYNSLSVVRLNADMRRDVATIELVDDMISYYRAVLNKGDTFVRLDEEIRTIGLFMRINERAYGQTLNFRYDIPDELMGLRIPCMLLHTFVENAVVHGLGGKEGPCGVFISCRESDGKIRIVVEDNGYGIPEEKLLRINRMEGGGYGIKNAFRRMQIAFGEDVTLRLESRPQQYTRVYLIFSAG